MSTAHTGKSARHGQTWLRRGAGMLVIPALCWAVMALACALAGTSLLTGVSSLRLFVRERRCGVESWQRIRVLSSWTGW